MKKVYINKNNALSLDHFKEMDRIGVEEFGLPIELMMENAGLMLAKLVALKAESKNSKIKIGVGNGNNGGGGLVAARRLAAWGYSVNIDTWGEINRELPKKQFERALSFGASLESVSSPDIWVDAYLGFSQRLPLGKNIRKRVEEANGSEAFRISLDIPTGFLGAGSPIYFQADAILTLAAPKQILNKLDKSEIYVADLGIPHQVYTQFAIEMPPFEEDQIIFLKKWVYIHEHVQLVYKLHGDLLKHSSEFKVADFLEAYALNLKRGFEEQAAAVRIDISNYYKPFIGKTKEEIFQSNLQQKDFLDIAAAVHGFADYESVGEQVVDVHFEKALDCLLAGEYIELRQMLKSKPSLAKQSSHFGHEAGLIHYCGSNAVEIYRQVVPENLREMINLLMEFGADPKQKIPVYGGAYDFYELFETSAHPIAAGVKI